MSIRTSFLNLTDIKDSWRATLGLFVRISDFVVLPQPKLLPLLRR